MEEFFIGSKGPQSVNSKLIKRWLSLGGPDLIRSVPKGAVGSESLWLALREHAAMSQPGPHGGEQPLLPRT